MKTKFVVACATALLVASAAYASQPGLSNYSATAVDSATASKLARLAAVKTAPRRQGQFGLAGTKTVSLAGYGNQRDAGRGTSTFLWADPSIKPAPATPLKAAVMAESTGRAYLGKQAAALNLTRRSIDEAKLVDLHDTGSGPVIARYQQVKDGIEVFGGRLNVMMDRSMKLVATSGSFAAAGSDKAAARTGTTAAAKSASASAANFTLPAEEALAVAFGDFAGRSASRTAFQAQDTADGYTHYKVSLLASNEILPSGQARTRQYWFEKDGKLVPAWYAEVSGKSVDDADQYSYGYLISAQTGEVLLRKNLVEYDAYTFRTYADATGIKQPYDSPLGTGYDPFVGTPGNGNVPRRAASTNLVTLQNGPISTNDPWLPPSATVTTGNNVDAYLDLTGTYHVTSSGQTIVDSGQGFDPGTNDVRGRITNGVMDFPYTPDADPSTDSQRQFAIAELFYVNNWLHDWWYDDGFDEKSGNGQTSNYGRGGLEGDPILAEGQDFSGRNNANMSTPPDGGSPRMQQYLFDGPVNGEVTATPAGGTAASYTFGTAAFGPTIFDVSGALVRSAPTNGCTALTNAAAVAGNIALIDRGVCTFKTKALAAQNAGAIGVIIANNQGTTTIAMGDDATITTPITIGTLSVTLADGNTIKSALAAGAVNARLRRAASIDRDGTVDQQIVAHEWFHHVSNRLVGNALGLSNQQGRGMGEGWSDFSALMLTVRPEDQQVSGNSTFNGAYPEAFYSTGDAYYGIRRAPYSTDFAYNPLTFKHIQNGVALPTATAAPVLPSGTLGNAEVHNAGEIWCNTLWEIYASLLNDPRYTFLQAQDRMKRYVIAGLKMTPNAPTFLEARDGLLAAAYATDKADFQLMAKAFAKRGMGVGAVAPDRNDANNGGVTESFTALQSSFTVTDASLDFTYVNGADGYIDNDGELDPGETALLKVTIRSNGTQDITAPITAKLTSDGDTTFGNGGTLTFPVSASSPLTYGGTTSGTITVKLNSATTTAQALALTISFQQVGTADGDTIEPPPVEIDLTVNYDIAPNQRASEDFEDPLPVAKDWPTTLIGTGDGWDLADSTGLFDTGLGFYGPDNNSFSDIRLTTPSLSVGTGAFSFAFDHYYAFEFAGVDPDGTNVGYDGGIIEVSTDAGATWTDVVDAGGTFSAGTGYNGVFVGLNADGTPTPDDSAASPHAGFVNKSSTTYALNHVVLSFGTAFAGKSVLLRFREVSDGGTSAFGWFVDNVSFTGVTTPPFSKTVPENGVADNQNPVANAGPDQTAAFGSTVTLDGSASKDPDGTSVTYSWTQTSGPQSVTLTGPTTAKPTFKPTASGTYVFTLTVTDVRQATSTDTVSITVPDNHAPTANAGPDQRVQAGSTVSLNGSASSDPDGDALTYAWTQTAGPAVTINGTVSAQPTVTLPTAGTYVFTLTVTDPRGATSSDTATVSVAPTDDNGGGGAFGFALLLPGLLLALGRRRRR